MAPRQATVPDVYKRMSRDLLIEMGCEDLPARFVAPLSQALSDGLSGGLARRGVAIGAVRALATPRRLACLVLDLADTQPEQVVERLGPALKAALKDGEPTKAALGFARSCGVEFAALGEKDGKLHYRATQPGRPTLELLSEIFAETLKSMDQLVPKRMRWGSGDDTFVRPVSWLCALFGDDVVPLRAFGLEAGRETRGHRFHAPAAIALESPQAYVDALRAAQVLVDPAERREIIRRQIEQEAAAVGGVARIAADLLDEVTALVEWPVAIRGQFEARFLELPPEVIVTTVETNQRYFTVFDGEGEGAKLTRHFITVSNIASRDVAQVIAGNERVVRPRLTDALFFWEQDLKQPLADYLPRLDSVTFQKELGSIGEKARRIAALAQALGEALGGADADTQRAAQLCKADLVTRMVFEMPELQGLMGGYYATRAGESGAVARAVREHYLPTQQGTPIPSTRAGQLVALADKLDSLAGIFAIGQKPTASKDPFALRRAALGVLRIAIEGGLELDLAQAIGDALALQPAGERGPQTHTQLAEFVADRLANFLVGSERAAGRVTPETFDAAANGQRSGFNALDIVRRVDAVLAFSARPEAPNLAAANKRARNILRQSGESPGAIDPARFQEPAEGALHAALNAVAARNAQATGYEQRLSNLAGLREAVDAFFEGVMVNAEDTQVRANRLALLGRFDGMCREVADLSCLPG